MLEARYTCPCCTLSTANLSQGHGNSKSRCCLPTRAAGKELGLLQESAVPPTLGHSISLHLSEGLPVNHPGNAIAHQQRDQRRTRGLESKGTGQGSKVPMTPSSPTGLQVPRRDTPRHKHRSVRRWQCRGCSPGWHCHSPQHCPMGRNSEKPQAWRAQQLTVTLPRAGEVLIPQQCSHKAESSLLLSLPNARVEGTPVPALLLHAFPLCVAHMFQNTFSFCEVKAKYQPSPERLLI